MPSPLLFRFADTLVRALLDDKLIEILRKYGIMAPMAGMAGAGVGSLYMDGEREGM